VKWEGCNSETREADRYTFYITTSESDTVKTARLAQVNRLRAELGLAPLKAHQIAHDRSLAEPKGLRFAGLIELCSTSPQDAEA
jgi:hypothetical protein